MNSHMLRWRSLGACSVLCRTLMLMLCVLCSVNNVLAEPLESRAILDESFSWMRKQDAERVMEKMKAGGLNVFIPCVWHGRGVTWRSKLAQKEPRWMEKAKYTIDPLEQLIDVAHKNGIQVHPWFTVMLRQRPILTDYYDEGTPVDSFNVHSPEFRQYITSVIVEVVTKYNVDGINLDFIRSKGICTSAFCIKDYREKTGRDLMADVAVHADRALGVEWMSIANWNRQAVTDVVRQISTGVRKIKPGLKISIDTHPLQNWLVLEGADGIGWANAGLIDLIYDMQYKQVLDAQTFLKARQQLNDPSKLALMVGNFEVSALDTNEVYPRADGMLADNLAKAIKLADKSHAVAIYEYSYFNDKQVKAVGSGPLFQYAQKP